MSVKCMPVSIFLSLLLLLSPPLHCATPAVLPGDDTFSASTSSAASLQTTARHFRISTAHHFFHHHLHHGPSTKRCLQTSTLRVPQYEAFHPDAQGPLYNCHSCAINEAHSLQQPDVQVGGLTWCTKSREIHKMRCFSTHHWHNFEIRHHADIQQPLGCGQQQLHYKRCSCRPTQPLSVFASWRLRLYVHSVEKFVFI